MFHDSLGMRLRGAYLSFHRQADAFFADFGLTADQFVLLSVLADEDGITQRMLCDRIYSDPNTTGEMLGRLEKKKLIRRERHPQDGRARCVFLTVQGRKFQRQLYARSEAIREGFRSAFRAEELAALGDLLTRFHQAIVASPARGAGVA